MRSFGRRRGVAEELARRCFTASERAHLVAEADGDWGPDPVGCGLGTVCERIAARPSTTCAELEKSVDLAPVKVRLAVAILVERGVLREEERRAGGPATGESDPRGWWPVARSRFPNGLRVVVGPPREVCPDGISTALEQLARDLGTTAPPVRYSPSGPTFVTLHASDGGLLSLSLVPMGRRHRFLVESLAAAAHFTIVCGGDGADVEAWTQPLAGNLRVRWMKGTCARRGCDLYTHIRRLLSRDGCPEHDGRS